MSGERGERRGKQGRRGRETIAKAGYLRDGCWLQYGQPSLEIYDQTQTVVCLLLAESVPGSNRPLCSSVSVRATSAYVEHALLVHPSPHYVSKAPTKNQFSRTLVPLHKQLLLRATASFCTAAPCSQQPFSSALLSRTQQALLEHHLCGTALCFVGLGNYSHSRTLTHDKLCLTALYLCHHT